MRVVFDIYKSLFKMNQFKIFIELTRLNKPIGYMLLFWPCSWGLAYGLNFNQVFENFFYFLILFFLGAVLMRSAGCIINDIIDVEIDKKVERTKYRPLASGKISKIKAFFYAAIICLIAFFILIQFNLFTIILGLSSMVMAFVYPFMKRITYWPQFFLGITFNWGVIMAWTSIMGSVSTEILVLYTSAIFWTLGYDTIYGVQDITDDEIIGTKSTAIKFKKNIKLFVSMCYLINVLLLIFLFKTNMENILFTTLLFIFLLSLVYQIKIFDINDPKKCLKAFKTNNYSGLILFVAILTISFKL
jgi:4-hydroxybenzoate polyprenyltransferase